MDPISALSVASSIITFVDFAASLISATKVIFGSSEGALAENLRLKSVYTELQGFSERLRDSSNELCSSSGHNSEDVLALQQLTAVCEKDCQELLDTLQALQVRGKDGRLWRSMRAAFRNRLGRPKITAIEGRLERTQRVISLHVNSIISKQITTLSKTVESMRTANHSIGHNSIIDSMSQDLEKLRLDCSRDTSTTPNPIVTADQMKGFVGQLCKLFESKETLQAEVVLNSLNYDFRPARHCAIPEAHRNTFQWAFTSHLRDWLQSGSGVFWVSGKAGSGKSTFIKFLADHPRTRELLGVWADSNQFGIASHYFWSAGTIMQKSQQGLLRSLLFDIFRNHPEIIPIVCYDRWVKASAGTAMGPSLPWTIHELSSVLRAIAATESLIMKSCFFIDGLDEYDGDLIELCHILQDLAQSPCIKICASSRPWVQFEDSFGSNVDTRIYMHDLTKTDIENFARDQLHSHPRWAINDTELDDSMKLELIDEIAERAEGVFLWAFLVTRSLREGLSNDDSISDMRKRLNSLPRDLDQLFKHMLEGVDVIYYSKMACALQAAIHAFDPLSIDIYWNLEKEFEDPNYAITCPIGVVSPSQLTKQREQARRRINARTKGLLEVRDNTVEFLHRSVRDFLLTREMSDYLSTKLDGNFEVFYSITKAYLAFLKTTALEHPDILCESRNGPRQTGGLFIGHLNQALLYAEEAISSTNSEGAMELLDEYERSVVGMIERSQIILSGALESCDPRLVFREEVVKHRLTPYVEAKLREEPDYFLLFEYSPLFAALTPMTIRHGSSCPSPDLLRFLLHYGEDPDAGSARNDFRYNSPWLYFAATHFNFFLPTDDLPARQTAASFFEIIEKNIVIMLLSFGADPDAELRIDCTPFTEYTLAALSEIPQEYEDAVLRTFDAFLKARRKYSCRSGRTPKISINSQLDRICDHIRKYPQRFWYAKKKGNIKPQIFQRIIQHLLDENEQLEPLASTLIETCPPNYRQSLFPVFRMIEEKGGGSKSNKRREVSTCGENDEEEIVEHEDDRTEDTSQVPKKRRK